MSAQDECEDRVAMMRERAETAERALLEATRTVGEATFEIARLRERAETAKREKNEWQDKFYALLAALRDAPKVPPLHVLFELDYAARWPRDNEAGKAYQREHQGSVPHKSEYEGGMGVWLRIRPGLLDVPAFDLVAHLQRQREWSAKTFGHGARTKGVVDHIRKELAEIEADPSDVSEWVDVVILAFDGAWRAGWEPADIVRAIVAKQTKNEARTWPDWRTMSPDQAIEHVRGSHD